MGPFFKESGHTDEKLQHEVIDLLFLSMKSDIVGICPEPDDTGFVRNNFPELI